MDFWHRLYVDTASMPADEAQLLLILIGVPLLLLWDLWNGAYRRVCFLCSLVAQALAQKLRARVRR